MLRVVTNPVTGKDIWYYEVEIKPFTSQVYPNLQPARLVGYDGISPGPSFVIPKGTETVVRFINNASIENSVHLHGSPSRAPFDGWAEDVTQPGQYKDYYYPNFQSARLLWYHDHGMHVVSVASILRPSYAKHYRLPKTPTSVRQAPTSLPIPLKTPSTSHPATVYTISPSSSHLRSTMQTVHYKALKAKIRASGAMSYK